MNGIRGFAVVERRLPRLNTTFDEKHPSKALIRKTLEGSGGSLWTEAEMFQSVMVTIALLKGKGHIVDFHL
ncbi:hypothetical protein ACVWXQ_003712 [Bradyrhizobium sp. S3.14.4]